jgi:hypothetical protein
MEDQILAAMNTSDTTERPCVEETSGSIRHDEDGIDRVFSGGVGVTASVFYSGTLGATATVR